MLCVKGILSKMFLYMHVSEICNFACVYMEQNCWEIFSSSFFFFLFSFLPCSPGESFFVILRK